MGCFEKLGMQKRARRSGLALFCLKSSVRHVMHNELAWFKELWSISRTSVDSFCPTKGVCKPGHLTGISRRPICSRFDRTVVAAHIFRLIPIRVSETQRCHSVLIIVITTKEIHAAIATLALLRVEDQVGCHDLDGQSTMLF